MTAPAPGVLTHAVTMSMMTLNASEAAGDTEGKRKVEEDLLAALDVVLQEASPDLAARITQLALFGKPQN